MRCLGLAADRRRCREQAADSTGYCESHREEWKRNGGSDGPAPTLPSRRIPFLGDWRSRADKNAIPDDARFNVPRWLRTSSTSAVVERLLNDPNPTTRWLAAFTLRKRREPAAIDPLWQVLDRDPVSLVRQQAAVGLGKIGTLAVIGPLVQALWHDPDAGVRQASAIALGNLGYAVAAGELASVLEHEQAAFVRWDCVLALGQIGDDAHAPLLSTLASADRTQVVRHACGEALADIHRRAAS